MANREWIQPQLIVLARGTPEESLEAGCKIIAVGATGAIIASQDSCNRDASTNCGACKGRSGVS